MKVFFCSKCHSRIYQLSYDKEGDKITCIDCGKENIFHVENLVDEFDYSQYPINKEGKINETEQHS